MGEDRQAHSGTHGGMVSGVLAITALCMGALCMGAVVLCMVGGMAYIAMCALFGH